MPKVTVLGAGSWGSALAVHLSRVGHEIYLWGRDPALVDDLRCRRENAVYLPGIALPAGLSVSSDLEAALEGAEIVVSAIPSHGCRDVMRRAARLMAPRATIVSATKGLETDTLRRMSEVIVDEAGPDRPVVVLSG